MPPKSMAHKEEMGLAPAVGKKNDSSYKKPKPKKKPKKK